MPSIELTGYVLVLTEDSLDAILTHFLANTKDMFYDGAMMLTWELTEFHNQITRLIAWKSAPTLKDVSCICYHPRKHRLELNRIQLLDWETKNKFLHHTGWKTEFGAKVWRITHSFIGANAESERIVNHIVWDKNKLTVHHRDPETERRFTLAECNHRTRENRWIVRLGEPNLPAMQFLTDPTGVRELFVYREPPEGRTRRAMLKNWITSHWRQLRSNPDLETRVRAHLRGHEKFRWCGFDCEIVVPPLVVEAVKDLKLERNIQRLMKLDRRPRWK